MYQQFFLSESAFEKSAAVSGTKLKQKRTIGRLVLVNLRSETGNSSKSSSAVEYSSSPSSSEPESWALTDHERCFVLLELIVSGRPLRPCADSATDVRVFERLPARERRREPEVRWGGLWVYVSAWDERRES